MRTLYGKAVEVLLGHHVASLRSLGTVLHIEGDLLSLSQGLKATALDCTKMYEYIRTAVVLGNKTKTFSFVKPLHSTCCHDAYPSKN